MIRSVLAARLFRGIVLFWLCALAPFAANSAEAKWWKGNLHTHSMWSDGDDYPEMIVSWYKDHGYNFLALSDHNRLQTGEKWVSIAAKKPRESGLELYLQKFGTNWVERRKTDSGDEEVRLKTLGEYRGRFETPGHFLLIPAEEISDHWETAPIHLNATNLRELVPPQGGATPLEVMQRNIDAVLAQRAKTGLPMIPHINHPNFVWALTAEDIMRVQGERFLEIYNGHPVTRNYGDTNHASAERIWDIVLTRRLAELNLPAIWGTAVDDSHQYHTFKVGVSNPGRGWLMVQAEELSAGALIAAMEEGNFYASSGVQLARVRRSSKELAIEVKTEPGVSYVTEFIGTRKGYDRTSEPVTDKGKEIRTTRRYSGDIGMLLGKVEGPSPSYRLKGDEIYVRARVTSSKPKQNPMVAGDVETAWVQPVITGVK